MDNGNIILDVENPQSREEDEELEEQRRRQEELTNLLADGIHAYTYDESTINSSVSSVDAGMQQPNQNTNDLLAFKYDTNTKNSSLLDTIEQTYRDVGAQDQLKVLYDVRVREINHLKEEFARFQAEKAQEIGALTHKATFSEAEICHLQIAKKNLEDLLVDKSAAIKSLQKTILEKDADAEKKQKTIDQMSMEIISYKSVIQDFQLQLADNNPFSSTAKLAKTDEMQKVHHDQIIRLETLLQEQTRKSQILEQENNKIKEDLQKLTKLKQENDEENNYTIKELSKKLQNYQLQCRELFVLGEAIKAESDHFKERCNKLSGNKVDLLSESFRNKSMDKETLSVHLEKLKRMLLDKDIEMTTLQTKLKLYNSSMEELFHYRQVLDSIDKMSEISRCSNGDHAELFVFLQRQLQSYQQAVDDRNKQILSLKSVNKELQEKIEEMIVQTRNEIQNLSEKYSLPQLETMSNELRKAEHTIADLQKQLNEKNTTEMENLKKIATNEKQNFDEMLAMLKKQLQRSEHETKRLQTIISDHEANEAKISEENRRLKAELLKTNQNRVEMTPMESQVHHQLHQIAENLENGALNQNSRDLLQNVLAKMQTFLSKNFETTKMELESDLNDWIRIISSYLVNNSNDEKLELEKQLKIVRNELQLALKELNNFKDKYQLVLASKQEYVNVLEKMGAELNECKTYLKVTEASKKELESQLNKDCVRKKLYNESKEAENSLGLDKSEGKRADLLGDGMQADLLKAELNLRDELQAEMAQRIGEIEALYKGVVEQKMGAHAKEREAWRAQEMQYRKHFAAILEECGRKMTDLEQDNVKLFGELENVVREYQSFRVNDAKNTEAYVLRCQKIVKDAKNETQIITKKWEELLEFCVRKYVDNGKQTRKKVKKVLNTISSRQTEIDLIQRNYEMKVSEHKRKNSIGY